MIKVFMSYVEELEGEARAKRKAIEELQMKINRLGCIIDFVSSFLEEVGDDTRAYHLNL